ncbi:fatty acid desaturase [Burkholderia savannae]|uniref:Fatty acid desaturase n=1 Tax=Burkholderia savannae TaxID=1637837 RepID=A0ABR5TID2_9BURK|nr:fatty acid desaturase [Burkholderia savannae]
MRSGDRYPRRRSAGEARDTGTGASMSFCAIDSMNDSSNPIRVDEPMPHRKVIRSWITPFGERVIVRSIALLVVDYLLLLAALEGALLAPSSVAKIVCGMAAGFVTGRLFIIGHDACHQSLTPNHRLNRWLGRIAFLPSLTPYSLWEVGHNVVHHGYTNLKGFDFVWAPHTPDEFAALSPTRRFLDRIYRSGWAPGLYYLVEIWWLRMYFPAKAYLGASRPIFRRDCLLVTGFAALWIGAVVWIAAATHQSTLLLLVTGFAVPFLFWCSMIGFVVYVHHTDPRISWHANRAEWSRAAPFVSTTLHLTFPFGIGGLLHHIMEHTAHHVDMSIPLYGLKGAQAKLEAMLPGRIVVQRFGWRWYFDTARRCKLYDTERKCWTDYRGRATSDAHLRADAPMADQRPGGAQGGAGGSARPNGA